VIHDLYTLLACPLAYCLVLFPFRLNAEKFFSYLPRLDARKGSLGEAAKEVTGYPGWSFPEGHMVQLGHKFLTPFVAFWED